VSAGRLIAARAHRQVHSQPRLADLSAKLGINQQCRYNMHGSLLPRQRPDYAHASRTASRLAGQALDAALDDSEQCPHACQLQPPKRRQGDVPPRSAAQLLRCHEAADVALGDILGAAIGEGDHVRQRPRYRTARCGLDLQTSSLASAASPTDWSALLFSATASAGDGTVSSRDGAGRSINVQTLLPWITDTDHRQA